MGMVIRLRKNGPIVVDGDDIQVVDWDGAAYAIDRRPVALCRCGASERKPFCDGSHARAGVEALPLATGTPSGPGSS